MSSFFSDILGAVTSGLLPDELTDLFETDLPQVTAPDITFKPFTVTGSQGGQVTTDALGSTKYNLSPEQQAMQQQLFGGAGNFYRQASNPLSYTNPGSTMMTKGQQLLGQTPYGLSGVQDASKSAFGLGSKFMQQLDTSTADREADIYERMRAVQRPEELRQQQAMQEQMFAQGRGGVRTEQYGGTPEQLAMYKAQAEAQNSAMLGAMGQAQAEQQQLAGLASQYTGLGSGLATQSQQMTNAQQAQALQALQGGQGLNLAERQQALAQQAQQASLGSQYLQSSYAPQAALLSAMSPALNVAGMADVAKRQQGEYNLEAQVANMQGKLGQQTGMANLYGGVYGGLLGGLGSIISGSGKDGKPWWLDF